VKFSQLLLVRRRRARIEIDLASFFVEHKHDGGSGMVQNVRGGHVQQNLQQSATNFEKAATNGFFFWAFVAALATGVS